MMKKLLTKLKKCVHKDLSFIKVVLLIMLLFVIVFFSIWFILEYRERNHMDMVGTREMWVGLIGSLTGGFFSFLGVNLSIHIQGEREKERLRVDNMPILKIEHHLASLSEINRVQSSIFTLYAGKLSSTDFPSDDKKRYPILDISLDNNKAAYEVCIDSIVTTDLIKEPKKEEDFFPEKYRLVADEHYQSMIYIKYPEKCKYYKNVMGIIRIKYSDGFGNMYFQDVPFSYNRGFIPEYMFEIYNLKSPILIDKFTPTLYEIAREEYSYFYPDNTVQ